MKINKVFVSGKMNKDIDERYLKNGDYRDATNVRVLSSEGSDMGTVENVQGNERLTNLGLTNAEAIGGYADHANEKLYWFVIADRTIVDDDDIQAIVEYHKTSDTWAYILQGNKDLLNFTREARIKGANLIDGLLFWTDGRNAPRCINIERAKEDQRQGKVFTKKQIQVLKPPPLAPPTINLIDNGTNEDNLKEKFIAFSYRYKYLDGYYSALSPFTSWAFRPKNFIYDFKTGTNDSMANKFNAVEITYNTGDENVIEVDLLFKESGSSLVFVIESFNKERLWVGEHSVEKTFTFDNSKIYQILPENEIHRIFDNVPIWANVQESMGNRVMYGDYLEHYDVVDSNGDKIELLYTISLNSYPVTNAVESLKSNRDYEIGVNYLDDDGRITTTLTSKTNTLYIPNSNAILQNKIQFEIQSDPPSFATKYRLFIKQSKGDYQIVSPNIFYNEGDYVWLRLDGKDKEKINEGDFLVVKSAVDGIVQQVVYTEVLEIKTQERNFLELVASPELKQQSGLYFRVSPENVNLLSTEMQIYTHIYNIIGGQAYVNAGETNHIEKAVYIGVSIINDLTSSGTYTGVIDRRYRIGMFSLAPDTFKFSTDEGVTWDDNTALGYPITAGLALDVGTDGLKITFASNTGHFDNDLWNISCKASVDGFTDPNYAYGVYSSDVDTIFANANLYFAFKEDSSYSNTNSAYVSKGKLETQLTSSKEYANIEEWWFGDKIQDEEFFVKIDPSLIRFRRCVKTVTEVMDEYNTPVLYDTFTEDPTGKMYMFIRSVNPYYWDEYNQTETVRIMSQLQLVQNPFLILFETKPLDSNSDVFFEIGETYNIINSVDEFGDPVRIHEGVLYNKYDSYEAIPNIDPELVVWGFRAGSAIELNIFNCFCFGNGFESYKIKDGWNSPSMKMDTRPMLVYNDYKQVHKKSSVTYSGIYNKSTNINNLNEFNLSLGNFKDLDEKFGNIGVLYNDIGDLLVIQEDSTSQLLYNKQILYDAQGVENVATTTEVLGSQKYHAGEYGISQDARTFAVRGGRKYWLDSKRGCAVRLGGSGIEEISKNGMTDWFKDIFKANTFGYKLGAYDPYYDEYVSYIRTAGGYKTLTFNETPKGWTSFVTYEPEFMLAMNNDFYSFKNGELYEHHSNNVPRQEFYGESNEFDITLVVNDEPSMDKVFKTFSTESTAPFDIAITTNYTNGNIYKNEFTKKESWYYADIKQSENDDDLTGFNANGIGRILAFNNYNKAIMLSKPIPHNISIGDMLWMQWADNDVRKIGTIINIADGNIFLDVIKNPLEAGKFIFATKNSRIEGSEIRGYFLEAKLTSDSQNPVELNGINVNTNLSHV